MKNLKREKSKMKRLLLILTFVLAFVSVNAHAWDLASDKVYTITTGSVLYLAANKNRTYLLVQNQDSSIVVTVNAGAAQSSSNGVKVSGGGHWEPITAPNGAIYLKAASGSPIVEIVEGN